MKVKYVLIALLMSTSVLAEISDEQLNKIVEKTKKEYYNKGVNECLNLKNTRCKNLYQRGGFSLRSQGDVFWGNYRGYEWPNIYQRGNWGNIAFPQNPNIQDYRAMQALPQQMQNFK